MLGLYLACVLGVYWHIRGLPASGDGLWIAADFRVFWGASYLALHGHAVAAYNSIDLFPAVQAADPRVLHARPWIKWFYPPTFFVVILPLALMPMLPAYVLCMAASFAGYLKILQRLLPGHRLTLLVCAFPPTYMCMQSGQNGFLTAMLAGFGLFFLKRTPWLAGVCIGLLSIKPHLAVLFPLALLCSRSWRAMGVAALTVICLTLAGMLLLGVDVLPAFFEHLRDVNSLDQSSDGAGLLPLMTSVVAMMRLFGYSYAVANVFQSVVAIAAAIAVCLVWRRALPFYLKAAVLCTASLLISPHQFDYDLPWLALPLAWMAGHALEHGWRRGERELLVFIGVSPLLSEFCARAFSFAFEPLVLLLLMALLLHRAFAAHARQGGRLAGEAG